MLRNTLFVASHWSLDRITLSESFCAWSGLTPVNKVILKSVTGPSALLLFSLVCILAVPFKISGRRKELCCHLISEVLLGILVFYQSMAKTFFSLISCENIAQSNVLYIDGTIDCFQVWQYFVIALIFVWVVPFTLVFAIGPPLLMVQRIPVSEIVLSCIFPLPVLFWWVVRKWRCQWESCMKLPNPWLMETLHMVYLPFKNISVANFGIFSWNGILFSRRLFLTAVFVFMHSDIWRLILMFHLTFPFLAIHKTVHPCTDKNVNTCFFCLLGSLVVSMANLVKAAILESLSEIEKEERRLIGHCDICIDCVMMWIPLALCLGFILVN